MKAAVQQHLAKDAATAAARRAAAARLMTEANKANDALLAKKKIAIIKAAEADAVIATYVRKREAREAVRRADQSDGHM